MSKPKKEYTNISAKMIEYHNSITPFIRSIKSYGLLKIFRIRNLLGRDLLENEIFSDNYNHDYTLEYIVLNKFILDCLPKDEYDTCIKLIISSDINNKILGANMIYTLVEAKKEEIKSKLNGNI